MADRSITFSTKLDNGDLEKALKDIERKIADLEKKLAAGEDKKSAIEEQLEKARDAARATEAAIDALKAKMAEVEAAAARGDVHPLVAKEQLAEYSKALEAEQSKLADQRADVEALEGKWGESKAAVDKYAQELDQAKSKQAELSQEHQRAMQNAQRSLKGAASGMSAYMVGFSEKINKAMTRFLTVAIALRAVKALKDYIAAAAKEDERFQASFANLKATLQGFVRPLIGILIPAITAFVNVLSAMLMKLAEIVDMIFKTNIVQTINQARAAAMSASNTADDAADATGRQADAAADLARAQKEANRQLMAFDELNRLNDDDNGASAYGGGLDELGGQPEADWNALDVGKIDEKLSAIMIVLGAALMAVGALLAFSGINIPVGLTLMAVGALMVYTAASENWQTLPQEVKDAINACLVLTGTALLVIGLILALSSPTHVMLGVGLIAAGAALLFTALALNWDSMPEEIRNVVSVIMAIVGTAFLVLGFILIGTPGMMPLAIALIGLGAVALATDVGLNWEWLQEHIGEVIDAILTIVAGAALVIGIILTAAASPLMAPLGIALIAAGAALLARQLALNWDKLPNDVQNTITRLLTIIGSALLVLGVILCLTGAGIPLGLGLIIAGAGSLAAAIIPNADGILEAVGSVWDSVCDWWEQNVAPIFTPEFWGDLFGSIGQGFLDVVGGIADSIGGFFEWVGEGLSGVMGDVGWGYSYYVPSYSVPYLASGAVIPPNSEFLAVLGDQRYGNNVEAPESLIRQIVREEAGGVGSAEVATLLSAILDAVRVGSTIYVDRQVLGRVAGQEIASMARMSGR